MRITGRPEPLLNRALIVSAVSASLSLLEAFGVPITPDQQSAINNFLLVVMPLVLAFWARHTVTPVADPQGKTVDGRTVDLVPADGSESEANHRHL